MQKAPAQATQDYEKYRSVLVRRQEELRQRLYAIEQDLERPRDPDDDDRAIERNNDEVLEELGTAGQSELAAIDAALDRLNHGTFGRCSKCGDVIDERRLDAVPYTAICQDCARSV
ncbi:TraR/DksA family transcriptional regulator [Rhizobium vallis]|uniref:TraR/DksA family transcriptional regulator n=1 Tax=Rhizobium vallis TaxID=634290 RepID=A0A3S0TD24_9HYPH|nr:TraR/DksA C4-type zinc finger protein [Rhizobium vallis]RUM25794.1 TraR/DksA family transcriptional regulator [Rhizobium vallis]